MRRFAFFSRFVVRAKSLLPRLKASIEVEIGDDEGDAELIHETLAGGMV